MINSVYVFIIFATLNLGLSFHMGALLEGIAWLCAIGYAFMYVSEVKKR